MTQKVLHLEEEITNMKKNKPYVTEPFKDTHEYENSTHVSEMKIPTVVYGKSKVFKNEHLKCQQFYYKCQKKPERVHQNRVAFL